MNKIFLILALLFSGHAHAYDWNGKTTVRMVEGTYIPDLVAFSVNEGFGGCKAGDMLRWYGKMSDPQANVKAIYSGLLSALNTGNPIYIYGSNNSCQIEFIHFLAE